MVIGAVKRCSMMLVAAGLLLAGFPIAPAAAQQLSGEELRREISGNTVTGVHDDGMRYSEFHSPDGKVFGHNNHDPVDRGCWDIKGDEVCYYYAGGLVRGTFCWSFTRAGQGFRLVLPRTGTLAVGIVQRGNPHNFSENGKPWTCEPLISRAPAREPRVARR